MVWLLAAGCGGRGASVERDSGAPDPGRPDATFSDAEPVDSAPTDVGFLDAEPVDMGPPDTGVFPDAEPVDMGPPDTGVFRDAEPVDMGPPDTGVFPDAEPVDMGPPDSGNLDAGTGPDAGIVDSGSAVCATPSPVLPFGTYSVEGTHESCFAFEPGCTQRCTTAPIAQFSRSLRLYETGGRVNLWFQSILYPQWLTIRTQQNGSEVVYTMWSVGGDCLNWGGWSDGTANVRVDHSDGSIVVDIVCFETNPGPCVGVPSDLHRYHLEGTYRCAEGDTRCVRDSIVTCDSNGTVTSSVSCGAPCAP